MNWLTQLLWVARRGSWISPQNQENCLGRNHVDCSRRCWLPGSLRMKDPLKSPFVLQNWRTQLRGCTRSSKSSSPFPEWSSWSWDTSLLSSTSELPGHLGVGGGPSLPQLWPPLGGDVLRLLQVQLFLKQNMEPSWSWVEPSKERTHRGKDFPFPGDLWVPPFL